MASLIDRGITSMPGPVGARHVVGAFGFAGRECPDLDDAFRALANHPRAARALAMGLNVMLHLLPDDPDNEDEAPND